jgi:hypothetical protein
MYGVILCVLAFSTLEQFGGLNDDLFHLDRRTFHALAFVVAFGAALFEAVTLRGLTGVRHFWERPDPIASVANRSHTYRAALSKDLQSVRKLALKRYGWAFTLKELQRWHRSNPLCLYLMVSEGDLVGYVDAFPITAADHDALLAGGREQDVTPLRAEAVDATCSFYIASVVIEEAWGGLLPACLKNAVTFYSQSYGNKAWCRVCAVGYSPEGRTLLEMKQARRVHGRDDKVQMYTVDRSMLPGLSRSNRAVWSKLLPTP